MVNTKCSRVQGFLPVYIYHFPPALWTGRGEPEWLLLTHEDEGAFASVCLSSNTEDSSCVCARKSAVAATATAATVGGSKDILKYYWNPLKPPWPCYIAVWCHLSQSEINLVWRQNEDWKARNVEKTESKTTVVWQRGGFTRLLFKVAQNSKMLKEPKCHSFMYLHGIIFWKLFVICLCVYVLNVSDCTKTSERTLCT